jgi:A/G-specific adenine glycosylase
MELGAKVCSFKSPRCLLCPVQAYCVAFRTGMQDKIPPVKKRPATVHVHLFAIMHKRDDRYLMRPVDGMWEFPMFSELPAGAMTRVGTCRHTITHHRLDVSVYEGEFVDEGCAWKDPQVLAISSLTRKILKVRAGFKGNE